MNMASVDTEHEPSLDVKKPLRYELELNLCVVEQIQRSKPFHD